MALRYQPGEKSGVNAVFRTRGSQEDALKAARVAFPYDRAAQLELEADDLRASGSAADKRRANDLYAEAERVRENARAADRESEASLEMLAEQQHDFLEAAVRRAADSETLRLRVQLDTAEKLAAKGDIGTARALRDNAFAILERRRAQRP